MASPSKVNHINHKYSIKTNNLESSFLLYLVFKGKDFVFKNHILFSNYYIYPVLDETTIF